MTVLILILIAILLFVPAMKRRELQAGRPRSPIEPGGPRPSLPREAPAQPGLRDGKATVDSLTDDFAEGRISVEEYERRLDRLYRGDPDKSQSDGS